MLKRQIEAMPSTHGGVSRNNYIITEGNKKKFYSYMSLIAIKQGDEVILDRYWYKNCSKTTGIYRSKFLGETKAETIKKVESGEYKLRKLN